MPATLTPWPHAERAPSEQEVFAALKAAGAGSAYRWENGPHASYAPHVHSYAKVLFCVRGSIRFTLTAEGGEALDLRPGDRLDLAPHTEHRAEVGPAGVVCVEGRR